MTVSLLQSCRFRMYLIQWMPSTLLEAIEFLSALRSSPSHCHPCVPLRTVGDCLVLYALDTSKPQGIFILIAISSLASSAHLLVLRG